MAELITSRKNALISQIRSLQSTAKNRREQGLFLLDGRTLLEEALRFGRAVETVVFVQGAALPPLPETVRQVQVPPELMASIAPTNTPQGILTLCKLPELHLPQRLPNGRYLVLDHVQDPGNVGAILRSCAAFGAQGMILCGACADPYGPKAVRASMGAIFRCPVYTGDEQEILQALSELPLYRADLTDDAQDIRSGLSAEGALLIGSEGQGVSAFWRERTSAVTIPMHDSSESLNAAAAASILLWEMSKNGM